MPKKYIIQCLEEIVKELGDLKESEYLPPTQTFVPGEVILGEMNDENKRLCTLWNRLSSEGIATLEKLERQGKIMVSQLSKDEELKLKLIDENYALVEKIMWFSVQKQVNGFTKPLGIRSNWNIVIPLKAKTQEYMERLFRQAGMKKIGGGMGMFEF